ncbi:MAG: hypothetical protein Q8M71_10435 [Thermodesulfovibrionales bacterium]|nr:hypothetical protein [Thermodesulfovibrionales bacterium]
MLGAKDFLVGCLAIILCALLIPLLYLVCKLSLSLAIAIGVIALVAIGIALFGKIIRLIFSKEQ